MKTRKLKPFVQLIVLAIILTSYAMTFIASSYFASVSAKLQNEMQYYQEENSRLWIAISVLQKEPKDTSSASFHQVEVCDSKTTFKSWMDYRSITSRSSEQWKLLQQKNVVIDELYGFISMEGYLFVAMGPQYGPVGSKYLISFSGGTSVQVIIGDIKHQGCTSSRDGSMVEFIVDKNAIPESIKQSGNFNELFRGHITSIYKEDESNDSN